MLFSTFTSASGCHYTIKLNLLDENDSNSSRFVIVIFCFTTSRIKRNPNKDFRITSSTKVCSTHFEDEDFKSSESRTRRLKEGACSSVFSWSKPKTERSFPVKKALLKEEKKIMEAEETETASEGEGSFEVVNVEAVKLMP